MTFNCNQERYHITVLQANSPDWSCKENAFWSQSNAFAATFKQLVLTQGVSPGLREIVQLQLRTQSTGCPERFKVQLHSVCTASCAVLFSVLQRTCKGTALHTIPCKG